MKNLKIELKRMYRSKSLQLSILLLILIAFLGIILNNIFYAAENDSRLLLLSLYNSFSQFTYLVLAFVFVSVFCKDFQNGVYGWYKQMGYSFEKVAISKFLSLMITVLPILNIIFFISQVFSSNENYNFLFTSIVLVNLNIIYIIALSFFLSVIFKKVIISTMVMYGTFVLFNGLNLCFYGLFNPSDSNSISTYYLGKLINPLQSHYSLGKAGLSDSLLCMISFILPIIWSIVLVLGGIYIKKYGKGRIKKRN